MSSYVPCKKNDSNGYIFYVSLVSQADTKIMQANPTLAAGDVKIAVDDAAPGNLGTLPVADADFTKRVKVTLSQGETNGDNLTIIFSDAAGAEWCDLTINIQTSAQTLDEIEIDVAATHVHAAGAETEATAAHGHASTIDGHITADYGATEKTCVDLLDDAAGGLADIHTDVGTVAGYVDKIDDATDGLSAIKAEVEGLGGATMRGTDSAALASVCTEARLAELGATNIPADIDAILADTGTDGVVIPQAQADKVWATAVRALTDKAGFTISGTKTMLDALNDISTTQVYAEAVAALLAYDPPTRAELTTDKNSIITEVDDLITRVKGLDAIYDSVALRALEATLTAIKGAGFTNETLKAIKDAIDALVVGGATAQEVWEYVTRTLTATPENFVI